MSTVFPQTTLLALQTVHQVTRGTARHQNYPSLWEVQVHGATSHHMSHGTLPCCHLTCAKKNKQKKKVHTTFNSTFSFFFFKLLSYEIFIGFICFCSVVDRGVWVSVVLVVPQGVCFCCCWSWSVSEHCVSCAARCVLLLLLIVECEWALC